MIRIGIVGCGRILAAHLRGFRILAEHGDNDFRITALCARQPKDAEGYLARGGATAQRPPVSILAGDPLAIGDEFLSDFQDPAGVKVYDDYADMIRNGPIDAVMDLTTHALHHRVAKVAFDNGKHLLSQKPMAATVQAGRRMIEQADRAGVTFGIFECFRYLPTTRAAEWLFRSGRAGAPQLFLVGYVGLWWAPDQIVAETPWRHRQSEGGGITLDLGVHFLHPMRLIAGQPVEVVGSTRVIEPVRHRRDASGKPVESVDCDADDTFFASIQFESGATANLGASWAGHAGPTTTGSVIYGSKARIEGNQVIFDDGSEHELVEYFRTHASKEEIERALPDGIDDWFALGQRDWLHAIRRGEHPEVTGFEGLSDLAGAFAILESDRAGRRVSFDDVLSGRLADYQRPMNDAIERESA